jgi:hypothetical protein
MIYKNHMKIAPPGFCSFAPVGQFVSPIPITPPTHPTPHAWRSLPTTHPPSVTENRATALAATTPAATTPASTTPATTAPAAAAPAATTPAAAAPAAAAPAAAAPAATTPDANAEGEGDWLDEMASEFAWAKAGQ